MATLSRANTGVLSRGSLTQPTNAFSSAGTGVLTRGTALQPTNNALSTPAAEESTNNGGFLGGLGYLSEKLAVGFVSSLEGLVDYTAGGVAKLFGADEWAEEQFANDWFGDWYSHPEEWYQPSEGWQVAGDVASGIGNTAVSLVGTLAGAGIAVASGGALAPLTAGMIGASLTAGLGAAGNATKEAYRETGKLDGKAFGYGALSGVTEGAMEGITNALTLGTGKIIKGIAGSVGKGIAKGVAKEAAETGVKATLKQLGKAFAGEAFEEGMSEVLSPYWKRMTYDPNAENATLEEIGYSAMVGGLAGLFMDGGRIAAGNTSSYLKGNKLARTGGDAEVLALSEQLSSFQEKNQTDYEAFQTVSDTYQALKSSLATTDGKVMTVPQKKMLGDLQKANISAVFTPLVHKSAVNIVSNADVIAEKLTAYGIKDASGKPMIFTAEQIRAGINTKNQKTLSRSFTKALEQNSVLRTLAVADATGHLLMDNAKFEEATLTGQRLASQVDINRFYETATPAEINAVSDALQIDNWATLDPTTLSEKIADYLVRGGADSYAETKRARATFEAIPPQTAQKMPARADMTSDGVRRYTEGGLSVAIEKKGDSYRVYDYRTGKLTKFVPAETLNGLLETYRTKADAVYAEETARQEEAVAIDSFARENVKEYKNLNDANQGMIRRLIRSGRAAGISDTDLATYAKVSARSGLDIVFDKEATARTDASGNVQYADGYYSASENRIVVNPEGTRSAERLLIHELDHAIRQSHGVTAYRKALEGVSDEVRQNIVKNYAGVADAGNRTALVFDETNARYAEDILSNKNTLERLIEAEPTMKERILSFFKGASSDYADAPRLSGAAKKYYRTYKKLFDSFAEGNYQGNAYGMVDTNKNAVTNMNTENMSVTEYEKKYAISEKNKTHADNFQRRIDAWDKKTEGFAFVMGETPSYLSELDVYGKKIGKKQVRIDATKIKKIMQDHSEMTPEVIKKLPYLLNDPILVLDSKTVKGRLVLLGEVYANNKPVMMALEINPTTRSGNSTYVDVIKVTSAYTRSNTQNLINSSNIRFVNENKSRVNDWLKVNRLQLPLPNSQSNSATNSIPQNPEKVNRNSEKTDKSFALPESDQKILFDDAFYAQFENESRETITETISELERIKSSSAFKDMSFDETFEINAKLKALKSGYHTLYDYYVKSEKKKLLDDYEKRGNEGRTARLLKDKKIQAEKARHLQNDISSATAHQKAQFEIIQKNNPMFDDYHTGIRSPKEIKSFADVVEDPESFTWGDFSRADARKALKDGTIKVYSSYPIKNGVFVSTSYKQALGYAGGKANGVHSRTVALNSVAWINGDEGQYAKVYQEKKDKSFALPDNEVTRSIREDEKKRNFNYSEGQEAKRTANENAKKVYTRGDASRIVGAVMAQTMNFGEVYGNLIGNSRKQTVEMLWKALNSAPPGERAGVALKIAEYTIDNAVVEDAIGDPNNEYDREIVSMLHGYVRKLDLSGIRAEIRHKYDKKSAGIFSRWGVQKGKIGISPDVAAMELAELGFQIDATHPADILFEMDAAYSRATQALKTRGRTALKNGLTDTERKKLQGQIVNAILRGYDTEGSPSKLAKTINSYTEVVRKLSGELREEKGRSAAVNRALDSVGKLRDIKLGKQHNATEFNDPLFRGTIGKLASIKYRGNLREEGTRKIFAEFAPWYHAKNQLFADQPDLYQESISEMIAKIASGEGDLTNEELASLTKVVDYFRHLVENFNKVYRKGQWVDAEPIAKEYVRALQNNQGLKPNIFGKALETRYGDLFADPISLARRMDYYENGFYTDMLEELRDAAVEAQISEMEILSAYDDFMKKNPKYLARAKEETVSYRAHDLPKMQAIGLYMTMKRKHAWAGIALSGFSYLTEKGDTVRVRGITADAKISQQELKQLIAEQRRALESQFTEADRRYIDILEQVYNHDARELKKTRDLQRLGYTNVTDDYYYPIRRSDIFKNVDTSTQRLFASDLSGELERVSNASFNKDTVKGAMQKLLVENADSVFRRHVRAVCMYANLSPAFDNYNRLYNMDVSGNKNDPVSVATEGANIWKKGDQYFRKLISDIQGSRTGSIEGMRALGFIRGGYAKFQLGANPKVWVTQLSSLFAASGMLDADSIMKGLQVSSKDVEIYCPLAKLRARDNTVAKSQGLIDKVDKVSDFFMKPIGAMDKFVVGRLFGACQVQVAKDGGAAVGTEKNKTAAGELLRRVILETQQNSIATERSRAMRSDNELLRTVTMFSADSMKVLGRVADSFGRHSVLKQRLRRTTDSQTRADLEKQLHVAARQARKSAAALLTSAVFMVAVAEGFRWLYNKERDDENVAQTLVIDFIGNLIGGLPILRDIYSKITDGYDLDNYAYSAANDLMNSTMSLFDAIGTVFSGEADSQKIASSIKSSVNALGQILGIPTRNLYNVTTGLVRRVSPTNAYLIDRVFYKKNYTSDLAKAVEEGDSSMVATVLELALNENLGVFSDDVRVELSTLTMSGYNVIPHKVWDSVSVDGVTVELTRDQQERIRSVYEGVDETLAKMFASSGYQCLSAEEKTDAVKYLYALYYERGLLEAGIDRENAAILLSRVVDAEKLALLYVNTKGLESDVDRKGATISGSKRKKVVAAINRLNVTTPEKLLLICSKGYSLQDGDIRGMSADRARNMLLRYILHLSGLSRAEKAELAEQCGFEVRNGKIIRESTKKHKKT